MKTMKSLFTRRTLGCVVGTTMLAHAAVTALAGTCYLTSAALPGQGTSCTYTPCSNGTVSTAPKCLLGMTLMMPNPSISSVAKRSPLDVIVIDTCHSKSHRLLRVALSWSI